MNRLRVAVGLAALVAAAATVCAYLIFTSDLRAELASVDKVAAELWERIDYCEPVPGRFALAVLGWERTDPAKYEAAKRLPGLRARQAELREELRRGQLLTLGIAGGVLMLGIAGIAAIPTGRMRSERVGR